MTQQKSFKRRIRARMDKTGESYTAARRMLIADGDRPDEGTPGASAERATAGGKSATTAVEMVTRGFDEQAETLLGLGLTDDPAGLRARLERARVAEPCERAVLTVAREVVPVAELAARVVRRDRPIVLGQLEPDDLATFVPIEAVELPDAPAYLAVDVDLGAGSRNVRPEEALREILAAGRSPLTIDEGIALMLQHPEAIARGWGFSLAGSRRGDQRVPAFWISEGRPKLGWCWDRNPHTWLGTASCAGRVAGGASSGA